MVAKIDPRPPGMPDDYVRIADIADYLNAGRPASYATDFAGGFSSSLESLLDAAKKAGHNVTINSGARSVEKQEQLWNAALKKYGSPQAARKWVAPPGSSSHNPQTFMGETGGFAADLDYNGSKEAKAWIHENAPYHGLHFRMGHEPWHIEPIGMRGTPKPADVKKFQQVLVDAGQPVTVDGVWGPETAQAASAIIGQLSISGRTSH